MNNIETDSFRQTMSSASLLTNHSIRIPGLWFPDGNVVLRAKNSVFKLKGEDLVSHCLIFDDIFSTTHAHDSESIEGCPVILLDDSPQEVEYFFTALFQPNYFPPPPATSLHSIVFGILRIAHKYGNRDLRYRSLQHLSTAFPTTLPAYDIIEQTRTFKLSYPAELFFAINIVMETNELWLLPYAFYQVIHGCSIEKIYTGSRNHVRGGEYSDSSDNTHIHISEENKLKCFHAYVPNLLSTHKILSFLAPPNPHNQSLNCLQPQQCNMVRFAYLNQVTTLQRTNHHWARHPLGCWDSSNSTGFYKDVCSNCRRFCEEAYVVARQKFWDELPGLFGMADGWDDFEKLKDEALCER